GQVDGGCTAHFSRPAGFPPAFFYGPAGTPTRPGGPPRPAPPDRRPKAVKEAADPLTKLVSILREVWPVAYVSLYRKWRPRLFSDVVGQQHVVRTLSNALGE